MSRSRKPAPVKQKAEPPRKAERKTLPEEMACDAIAHEEEAPDGKVWMTFRVALLRHVAEALAARAIREAKNIGALEAAAGKSPA